MGLPSSSSRWVPSLTLDNLIENTVDLHYVSLAPFSDGRTSSRISTIPRGQSWEVVCSGVDCLWAIPMFCLLLFRKLLITDRLAVSIELTRAMVGASRVCSCDTLFIISARPCETLDTNHSTVLMIFLDHGSSCSPFLRKTRMTDSLLELWWQSSVGSISNTIHSLGQKII